MEEGNNQLKRKRSESDIGLQEVRGGRRLEESAMSELSEHSVPDNDSAIVSSEEEEMLEAVLAQILDPLDEEEVVGATDHDDDNDEHEDQDDGEKNDDEDADDEELFLNEEKIVDIDDKQPESSHTTPDTVAAGAGPTSTGDEIANDDDGLGDANGGKSASYATAPAQSPAVQADLAKVLLSAKDDLRNKTFSTLLKEQVLAKLIESRQVIADVLLEKYRDKLEKGSSTKRRGIYHPHNATEVGKFLGGDAEDKHSWAVTKPSNLPRMSCGPMQRPGLFLRLSDKSSKSFLFDEDVGFISGSSNAPLNTREQRIAFLENQTNWKSRILVPGICSRSPVEFFTGNLTIINGFAVVQAGFPILRDVDEFRYYQVGDTKGTLQLKERNTLREKIKTGWYEHEYIALYRIPPSAIVATHKWREIEAWMQRTGGSHDDWVDQIAAPAFEAHEQARQAALQAAANQ